MYYDLLAKIKNAERAKKEHMAVPYSKMDFAVAKILAEARYIKDVQKKTIGRQYMMEIKLHYRNNRPSLNDFKIMSKPSRHFYTSYQGIHPVKQGYGLGVLSTSKGVMSHKEARKNKVGGEYLFEVW